MCFSSLQNKRRYRFYRFNSFSLNKNGVVLDVVLECCFYFFLIFLIFYFWSVVFKFSNVSWVSFYAGRWQNASPFLRRNIWPWSILRVLFIIKSLCTALIISSGQMPKSGIAVYSPFSSIHQRHSLNTDHVPASLRIWILSFICRTECWRLRSISYFPCPQNLKVPYLEFVLLMSCIARLSLYYFSTSESAISLQSVSAYSTWASLFILI